MTLPKAKVRLANLSVPNTISILLSACLVVLMDESSTIHKNQANISYTQVFQGAETSKAWKFLSHSQS